MCIFLTYGIELRNLFDLLTLPLVPFILPFLSPLSGTWPFLIEPKNLYEIVKIRGIKGDVIKLTMFE